MIAQSLIALAATAVVLVDLTQAHSMMIKPRPTYGVNFETNSFAGLIQGQTYLPCPPNMSYATSPEGNTEAYWIAFNASKYTSLKDLADQTMVLQTQAYFGTASAECGYSFANGTAQDLPDQVEWNEFGNSHQGPCEVWCDDKLAFMNTNCAVNYPENPAKLPYDVSVCIGAKMMQSYWIALQGLPWQLYLNCVPLKGGGASAAPSATPTSPSTTPTSPSTPPMSPSTPPASSSPPLTPPPTSPPTTPPPSPSNDALGDPTDSNASNSPVTTEKPEGGMVSATPAPVVVTPTADPAPESDGGTGGAKCVARRK